MVANGTKFPRGSSEAGGGSYLDTALACCEGTVYTAPHPARIYNTVHEKEKCSNICTVKCADKVDIAPHWYVVA